MKEEEYEQEDGVEESKDWMEQEEDNKDEGGIKKMSNQYLGCMVC